ncbi:zinc-finger associated domain (zf-AD) domain-containing protein [Phthorimaea operculella]|nr:zinc-finger associated domain (zf-AD) domain-containing protein [Phthorimaea operculella]
MSTEISSGLGSKILREDDIVILNSCRLCMKRHRNMKNLFTEKQGKMLEKIHFCTGLQLTKADWLPPNICTKCRQDLKIAFNFKTACLKSDECYRNRIKEIKIKTEHVTENKEDGFDDQKFVDQDFYDQNFDDQKVDQDIHDQNSSDNFDDHVDTKYDVIDEDGNDCKDILQEVMRLGDVKITKLKKESNSMEYKLPQSEQDSFNMTKNTSTETKTSSCSTKKARTRTREASTRVTEANTEIKEARIKTKESSTKLKKGLTKSNKTSKKCKKPSYFGCKMKEDEIKEYKKNTPNLVYKKPEPTRIQICEVCGKDVPAGQINLHLRQHYPHMKRREAIPLLAFLKLRGGVKQYLCSHCSHPFRTASARRVHVRSVHEKAPRRHACHLCEKSYDTSTKLRQHMDRHNGIFRYECEVCHSGFVRLDSWRLHLRTQHGVVKPPKGPRRKSATVDFAPNISSVISLSEKQTDKEK